LRGHPQSRLPTAADVAELPETPDSIAPATEVGHVNLRVLDLQRALRFYRGAIGLAVTQQDQESAFLAAGDYHHHLALNIWGAPAQEAPPAAAGLHHFALRLPDRQSLAEVVVRILRSGHQLLGATDHGVNLAVYLRDPDGNGLELIVDRPRSQ
jgi:catechol 2,3-dioxygenase